MLHVQTHYLVLLYLLGVCTNKQLVDVEVHRYIVLKKNPHYDCTVFRLHAVFAVNITVSMHLCLKIEHTFTATCHKPK